MAILVAVSFFFIYTKSLIIMFVSFECLLFISLNILRITSKSERIGEAVSEMFMWTLFGSFFLLIGFFLAVAEFGHILAATPMTSLVSHKSPASTLICVFLLIGFGVKIPTWPFVSWLLKAHVEASVEFSILLSGFIVKLGVLGLWRVLDALAPDWIYLLVIALSLLAIFDATLRLFAQNDLKKIVALTTVIEMNWLNLCYVLGDYNLVFLSQYLVIAHCITTTSEFLLVEYLSKRYGTRDFWQITGLWHQAPVLWYCSFAVILVTMGFPGTSIFFAKFLFLSVVLSYSVWLFCFFLFIFFLVLPLFFIRIWVPIWFGLNLNTPASTRTPLRQTTIDLTSKEFLLLAFSVGASFLLGLNPVFFCDIL
jgi:formate hydrogenlyase subunit 3/multisubunit Na+/H+ antiporter MnhD subunit